MRRHVVTAALSLLAAAAAQSGSPVGQHDIEWTNPTGSGAPLLRVRVLYPSPVGGVDAPMTVRAGGWPVIVFLHGFGLLGSDYAELGTAWASEGFAVVLQESAQTSYLEQVADGAALLPAIVAATGDATGLFADGFDPRRIAIAGHSMGGGSLGLILGSNPGYRCGFALAPVSPGASALSVHVPFGIVVGAGDTVTSWQGQSLPYYQAVAPTSGLKFCIALRPTCDHVSLAGLSGAADAHFRRTVAIGVGFFRHFLDVDARGLEHCIGPAALAAAEVHAVEFAVAQPRVWARDRLGPGRTVRVSLACEEGIGGVLAAASAGYGTPTPVGLLLLDPASVYTWHSGVAGRERRIDGLLSVPNNPVLVGARIALQGIGPATAAPTQLGSAIELVVGQ